MCCGILNAETPNPPPLLFLPQIVHLLEECLDSGPFQAVFQEEREFACSLGCSLRRQVQTQEEMTGNQTMGICCRRVAWRQFETCSSTPVRFPPSVHFPQGWCVAVPKGRQKFALITR